jgi:hypothetical protein
MQLGMRNNKWRYLYKPTPRNLRYFSHSPFARRAINAIKNPIKMLDWEITPLDDIELNSELEKQIEIVKTCFSHPNHYDSFQSFIEQVVEDYLVGAAAVKLQLGGDKLRPLWMPAISARLSCSTWAKATRKATSRRSAAIGSTKSRPRQGPDYGHRWRRTFGRQVEAWRRDSPALSRRRQRDVS